MYPSEWATNNIEIRAHHHNVVWVEDPYALVEPDDAKSLQVRLTSLGRNVVVIQNAFDLRCELLLRDAFASKLVVIDQSYTLRDPHLAPRDAKPGDLVSIPA